MRITILLGPHKRHIKGVGQKKLYAVLERHLHKYCASEAVTHRKKVRNGLQSLPSGRKGQDSSSSFRRFRDDPIPQSLITQLGTVKGSHPRTRKIKRILYIQERVNRARLKGSKTLERSESKIRAPAVTLTTPVTLHLNS
ncbi:hypothetical protein M9H77_28206 [Catharanthus roseus]|uniref:Uncharacterized protein n=1 Tax=Catharanthus roseus TaxID=4058 RepID=A0ACC0AEP9_CATRO|nr:hypothetical protein M9H77_28206 [Catharanthus roseus]